jgi:hypothetical protein
MAFSFAALFAVLQHYEDLWGDVSASIFEFWGACAESLANTDLRDL